MIELTIQVADPDDRLAQYGAGALVRIQSGAAEAGPFADIASPTVALLAGVVEYHVYDAGTSTTWYRTRFEDALGTTPSDWSAPFLGAALPVYLTLDELKAFPLTAGMDDESLLTLLDAAKEDIIRYAGPGGTTTELRSAHGDLLTVSAPVASVTSVVENDVTLDASDYELLAPQTLYRLNSGSNPSWWWKGRVRVTYQPRDDSAVRQRVQLELVKLSLTSSPGLAAQRIGEWSETYQASGMRSYADQRADILATLGSGGSIR